MFSVISKGWQEVGKYIGRAAICSMVLLFLLGCSQSPLTSSVDESPRRSVSQRSDLEEVSAPTVFQALGRSQSRHDPQIKIVGLKPGATLEQQTASIRFEIEDFQVFKDSDLGLGPHLQVFLDDQPYVEVYDAKQRVTFTDLKPGTHTVRVFASYPWHESFKAPSAFDQLTFNVFAPTQANRPDPDQPLLTYSQPLGDYGAEPIMVDYLITPPLSKTKGSALPSALEPKAKVQITVNGKSFITEESPPLFLKGFQPGVNWIKVTLLSPSGKAIPNALGETIQLVTFSPGRKDTVSGLVSGALSAEDAEQIISLETSQRRAAQKLEALSAPNVVPTPTAVDPTPPKESGMPLPSVDVAKPSSPQGSVTRPDTAEVIQQKPAPREPISVKKPEDRFVKPPANLSPAKTPKQDPLKPQTPEDIGSTPTSGAEDPIQSFLKRFRQEGAAVPSPSPSSQPKPANVPIPDSRATDRAENGDRPIPALPPAA